MTPDELAKLIPPAVVEAAAELLCKWDAGMTLQSLDRPTQERWRRVARAAIVAGLAAWPGAWTSATVGNGSLILPLPQEKA